MKLRYPDFEDMQHCEHYAAYVIDWHQGGKKYKKPVYDTHWRIYEGDKYRYTHSGAKEPEVRSKFKTDTYGTAELVPTAELPVLYTWDGVKVTKKHTYPQIKGWIYKYGSYAAGATSVKDGTKFYDTMTCLVDHEFGIALPLSYDTNIFLPYRTAQPVVEGREGSFLVYSVTRDVQKQYKERVAYINDRAKAIIALLDNSAKVSDIIHEATEFDRTIPQDFKEGRFDHWTMPMYLRAYARYVTTKDAIYALASSERHQKLYLNKGPR